MFRSLNTDFLINIHIRINLTLTYLYRTLTQERLDRVHKRQTFGQIILYRDILAKVLKQRNSALARQVNWTNPGQKGKFCIVLTRPSLCLGVTISWGR